MLGHALDVNCSRGQCLDFLFYNYLGLRSLPINFLFHGPWLVVHQGPCTLRYHLPSECTSCKVDKFTRGTLYYCTWTLRDRSQRPLVVTKLPLPPEPAWKSPISNGWETLSSCHSSLCYYVNLDILTLGHYEIEVWWSSIDSNESWEGLSEYPSGRCQKYVSRATSSVTMNQIYFKPE